MITRRGIRKVHPRDKMRHNWHRDISTRFSVRHAPKLCCVDGCTVLAVIFNFSEEGEADDEECPSKKMCAVACMPACVHYFLLIYSRDNEDHAVGNAMAKRSGGEKAKGLWTVPYHEAIRGRYVAVWAMADTG